MRDKYFYEKGILKFKRLRQIWIDFYGFWFFKEIDPQLAKCQIKTIDEKLNTQQDINDYIANLIVADLDKNKPLWEIHIKEDYDEETSVVIVLVHHLLSDGMGILTMISFMNEEKDFQSIDSFKQIPFWAYYILPLIYFPVAFARTIYKGATCKGDPAMYPLSLK